MNFEPILVWQDLGLLVLKPIVINSSFYQICLVNFLLSDFNLLGFLN